MHCRRLKLVPIFFFIVILFSPFATYGGYADGGRERYNR